MQRERPRSVEYQRHAPDARYEEEPHPQSKQKRGQRCCEGQGVFIAILVPVWIIAIMFLAIGFSVWGPYGKTNEMIDTAYVMLNQVNNSGITEVIYDVGTSWQTTNQTQNLLAMLDGANTASNTVFAIIDAIEPTLVADLMNKTSISVSNLLELIDSIVTQKGLNIQIPLGGFANMARRRLL